MKKITCSFYLICSLLISAQPGPNDGLSFNGIDEYILMPDSDNINTRPVNNRTIETYFKVDDATNRQTIYKEGGQVNSIKFIVEDGFLYLGCYRNSGGPNDLIYFRKPINDDTWYHVALVLDNASELKFYLDGVLQDSRPNFFQIPVHPGDFEIARSSGNTRYPACDTWTAAGTSEYCLDDISPNIPITNFFGGRIWGFRIWDVVRTDQEIDANKNVLITDTSTTPGNQLIAFLDGSDFNYQDSNDNFSQEVKQGESLGLNDRELNELSVVVNENSIKVTTSNNSVPESIYLYDLLGKNVVEVKNQSELSTSHLTTGIYILKIVNTGKVSNRKIVLRKLDSY